MQYIRQHIFLRFLWFVLAFQIFNCANNFSVLIFDHADEYITCNDSNEGDDRLTENDIHFFIHDGAVAINRVNTRLNNQLLAGFKEQLFSEFHPDICIPPPKA